MTATLQTTGSFMLSKEIEILMADRAKLLRAAGAAAQFVAVMDVSNLPGTVATEAEILAAPQVKPAAADRIETADEQLLKEFVQHKDSFVRRGTRRAPAA